MQRGLFITFEGGDGSGKSTNINILSELLKEHGEDVLIVREPGGTPIGERLRNVLLDPANEGMDDMCELLVYEASRAQNVSDVLKPAIEDGKIVLCDRFTDSTVAYQSYGRGLDLELVEQANALACRGLKMDRTIVLIAGKGASESLMRASQRGEADRLELAGVEFHERVVAGYVEQVSLHPDRMRLVSSEGSKAEVARRVMSGLLDLFPWLVDVSDDHITDIAKRF